MAMPETLLQLEVPEFTIDGFLAEEHARDLLRFSTAGSVDDGKSTLIGRLLYDTQSVYDDQVQSIQGKGTTAPGVLDLALLTDGLRAEREQGITIDVAYRYFSTAKRKFIIADTPGHEQYTRNMATGASTADLAIVLVDARKGVLIQSRRHACITALLGVRHIVVAVNKMDLVGYDEQTFKAICDDFTAFFDLLGDLRPRSIYFVPVSALVGDNVVKTTTAMPWYGGPSLLDLLESAPAAEAGATDPFRLAVQRVIRPDQNFRGFAGQIAAGTVRPGDPIMVLPSRRTSRVRSIVTYTGDLPEAHAPSSITLTLEDELDISRGDLLVSPDAPAAMTNHFAASLVWMDEQPLIPGKRYLLKHNSRTVQASVVSVLHRLDVATLDQLPDETLTLNGIGLVDIHAAQALAVDRYSTNRITGSFVLIDPITNATAAAGMIREITPLTTAANESGDEPVTASERAARWGHNGAHLQISGPAAFVDQIERTLFLRGAFVVRLDSSSLAETEALVAAGVLVLTHTDTGGSKSVRAGDHASGMTSNEELILFLQARAILKGDPK